jgi:hypothetical protein
MAYEHATARYRILYARLLRLYPGPYRERFGESMQQTFNDLCREHRKAGVGLSGLVVWIFVDTLVQILKEWMAFMITQNKNLLRIALVVGLILLIPLVLTLLNPNASLYGGPGGGWDWAPGDFLVMGALLFATGLALDFAVKKLGNPVLRVVACFAIVFALLLIWAELAVDAVSRAIALMS